MASSINSAQAGAAVGAAVGTALVCAFNALGRSAPPPTTPPPSSAKPPIGFVVAVEIATDRVPAFLAAIEADAVGSRGEPGCRRFDVWKVESGPDQHIYQFHEIYADSVSDVAFHKAAAHYAAWTSFKAEGGVLNQTVVRSEPVFPGPEAAGAAATGTPLAGKTVGIFLDYSFEDMEAAYPMVRLAEAGAKVLLIGAHKAGTKYTGKHGYPLVSQATAAEVSADDLDALVIPGGFAPDYMRRSVEMKEIVRCMLEDQAKPVAAICHGPWVLCATGTVL